MDEADAAQVYTEKMEQLREEERAAMPVLTAADSADNCEECGLEIPSARQLASPGCTLCIDCASIFEKKGAIIR